MLVQTSENPLTPGALFDRVTLSSFPGTRNKTKGTVQAGRYRERRTTDRAPVATASRLL
jgi:hypothetical protein